MLLVYEGRISSKALDKIFFQRFIFKTMNISGELFVHVEYEQNGTEQFPKWALSLRQCFSVVAQVLN